MRWKVGLSISTVVKWAVGNEYRRIHSMRSAIERVAEVWWRQRTVRMGNVGSEITVSTVDTGRGQPHHHCWDQTAETYLRFRSTILEVNRCPCIPHYRTDVNTTVDITISERIE